MTFEITVVLCTHNPGRKNISATVHSLKIQTEPCEHWELILIDNRSSTSTNFPELISWHPHALVVREDKLGLVHARIRAMELARSDLILFIDDDNELFDDYIQQGLEIGKSCPEVGAWGGQLLPKFESPPEDWTKPWWPYLAIRPLSKDLIFSKENSDETLPPGAGLFVRRSVWERYLDKVKLDSRHLLFGVSGNRRMSGEDTDLVLTSLDVDLDIGRFVRLKLNHRISSGRLREGYILSVIQSAAYSSVFIDLMRGNSVPESASCYWKYLIERFKAKRLPILQRKCYEVQLIGRRQAWVDYFRRNHR